MQSRDTYVMPVSPASGPQAAAAAVDSVPAVNKAQGHVPACLVNASLTYCGNDTIYAFGGFDQYTDEVYNHVLRLDLNTLRWELVDNFGDIPGVRMGHTASLYQGNKLIIFGGENEHREYLSDVIILDLDTSHWTLPQISGTIPRGRARHAAVIHDHKLFISGGVTGENGVILDDLSYLDLQTWTWSRTWSFNARYDHTAWIWGNRLWIFGGLDPNMERTSDIWWLDLKGSPSLTGMKSTPEPTSSPVSQQLSPRSGVYPANSASVQVRNLSRRKPLAPGAISSMRFVSGPNVPQQLSGTHFQSFTSGALLNFITPSETVRPQDCSLSALDLNALRWQRLADGSEIFRPGFRWHYCIVNETGTKAWLLGCSLDLANVPGASDENHMSQVLAIDLEKYGVLGNNLSNDVPLQGVSWPDERPGQSPVSGLGADLAAVFDQSPESGSGADFVVTAIRDDPDTSVSDDLGNSSAGSPAHAQCTFVEPTAATSDPIHVHKIILQLRWPHFKRLYAAQMAEYHANRMHIPEPYSAVRAFLYYLYTDSIAGHPEFCSSVVDVAGMLVMANLYDMPKLRLLCVNRLSSELDVENAAIVWERAGRTNEHWLMRRAAQFCLTHWGRIVRTDGFKSLSHESLIKLCEVVDTEGRIIAGPDLEMVSAFGADTHCDRDSRPAHNRLASGVSLDDESEDEDMVLT
ncbi:Kelch repeat and BTB/POZ domain-containing protein [Penicillium ucsense]|uniref:Kelch repeat and BTB/POZ domain-containing protein n=1 Tax=Penicillium ucsense TaxID=2839758 RepID=A0A8J8WLI6_9EURO|nr:Kelch repeat and BTB/POZ domain-containing protein [Penicillium ucsense]KAF7739238.1 Kelch repeat and BTB/POZ domain-containing protein [Penicillium ucsense]